MAKLRKKGVIGELSGKVGQIVIRFSKGEYVITTPPVFTKPPSEKQLEQREKFKEAVEYAQEATKVSPTKEIYEEIAERKKKYPMNVAVADFFHVPEIEDVDISEYHGKTGDLIRVKARDDVKVSRVAVLISDQDGNEVERGDAKAVKGSALNWVYSATQDVGTGEATVVVTVNDLAGNVVEERLEKKLED